jgi:hypothetical protein
VPGGWFVLAEPDPNSPMRKILKVTLDRDVTRDRHEDKVWEGPGEPGCGPGSRRARGPSTSPKGCKV